MISPTSWDSRSRRPCCRPWPSARRRGRRSGSSAGSMLGRLLDRFTRSVMEAVQSSRTRSDEDAVSQRSATTSRAGSTAIRCAWTARLHQTWSSAARGDELGVTTKERMLELTRRGEGKEDGADRTLDIEVEDVYGDIASVTVCSAVYHEYVAARANPATAGRSRTRSGSPRDGGGRTRRRPAPRPRRRCSTPRSGCWSTSATPASRRGGSPRRPASTTASSTTTSARTRTCSCARSSASPSA